MLEYYCNRPLYDHKNSQVGNIFGFTGREFDAESDLYYYRARYYNPASGRFLTADPIGFAGGDTNLYRYVKNNPINRTDPLGLFDGPANNSNLSGLPNTPSTYDEVMRISNEVLEQYPGKNNYGDAMRHSIWSQGMSTEINPVVSAGVGLLNEALGVTIGDSTLGEARMDLINNLEGINSSINNRAINCIRMLRRLYVQKG